ncbi:MAG: glutathione S-transferase N-terminal domain-containing protein, partial [Polaromonas sp.]|nr:glutathione S-transferase N-terminal domain-containing protein [Polaromonas sp.]
MTEVAVLYTFRRCPYAMRARLALATSGLPCELREISLKQKPPQMLAASAKGTVPVLVLPGGAVIDESLAIMQWALHQHDPSGWVHADERSRDVTLALIAHNDGPFKH